MNDAGVFPNLFQGEIPDIYKPQFHYWASESVLDMKIFDNDGLPRYSHSRVHPQNVISLPNNK